MADENQRLWPYIYRASFAIIVAFQAALWNGQQANTKAINDSKISTANEINKIELAIAKIPEEIPPPMFVARVASLEAHSAKLQESIQDIGIKIGDVRSEIRYLSKVITGREPQD